MAGKIKLYGPTGYTELAADVDASDNTLTLPSSGTLATFFYGSDEPTTTVQGFIWYDTTFTPPVPKFWDGSDFLSLTQNSAPTSIEYLVIAGGGGGGARSGGSYAGGGGAGGYRSSVFGEISGANSSIESKMIVSSNFSYTVTVGAGGDGSSTNSGVRGVNGSNSSLGTIVSIGGGGGGGINTSSGAGATGGSGGGGVDSSGGSGTSNQGFAGGVGQGSGYSGGGGGAGGVGANSAGAANRAGGIGISSSVSGSAITRSIGGIGGLTTTAQNGAANTGNGGSGDASGTNPGGSGGSGIVVIRYPGIFKDAITSGSSVVFNIDAEGNKVYIFNDSGTIAW
jgi:hypothetical protein